MMPECGKSASAIVAGKPANEVGQSTEESVEQGPRGMRTSKTRAGHRTGNLLYCTRVTTGGFHCPSRIALSAQYARM